MDTMLVRLARFAKETARSTVLFFLSPFIYILKLVVALTSRHSKPLERLIAKLQYIYDVIFGSSSSSSSNSREFSDDTLEEIHTLETSLDKRETELSVRQAGLQRQQQQLDAERAVFETRVVNVYGHERALEEKFRLQRKQEAEVTSRRELLDEQTNVLRREQTELGNLRDTINSKQSEVEQQRSDLASAQEKLEAARKKHEDTVASDNNRLEQRKAEINDLHDRFLRLQLESFEHHRVEHEELVEQLKHRLTQAEGKYENEVQQAVRRQQRSQQAHDELEQRCNALSNELAERTKLGLNLASELGGLRQSLKDQRNAFSKEFAEVSQALADLKAKCSKYELELAIEAQAREDLKVKEVRLVDMEKHLMEKEQDLFSRAQTLEEQAVSQQRQSIELAEREHVITVREIEVGTKENTLKNLESSIEDRKIAVAEAEANLASRIKTHEEETITKLVPVSSPTQEQLAPVFEQPSESLEIPRSSMELSPTQSRTTLVPTTPEELEPSPQQKLNRRTTNLMSKVKVANMLSLRRNSSKQ